MSFYTCYVAVNTWLNCSFFYINLYSFVLFVVASNMMQHLSGSTWCSMLVCGTWSIHWSLPDLKSMHLLCFNEYLHLFDLFRFICITSGKTDDVRTQANMMLELKGKKLRAECRLSSSYDSACVFFVCLSITFQKLSVWTVVPAETFPLLLYNKYVCLICNSEFHQLFFALYF